MARCVIGLTRREMGRIYHFINSRIAVYSSDLCHHEACCTQQLMEALLFRLSFLELFIIASGRCQNRARFDILSNCQSVKCRLCQCQRHCQRGRCHQREAGQTTFILSIVILREKGCPKSGSVSGLSRLDNIGPRVG